MRLRTSSALTERSATIHVVLELGDSSLSLLDLGKLNDTAALGARALEENLRELDLACGLKQFDKIFVRSRPRQLRMIEHANRQSNLKSRSRCGP